MEERHSCEEWSERLAARHYEDLSIQEHLTLQEHLASCLACSAAYQTYQSMEAKIRAVPTATMPSSILPILHARKQEVSCILPTVEAPRIDPPRLSEHDEQVVHQGRRLALLVSADIVASSSLPSLHDTEEDVQCIAHTLQEYTFEVKWSVGKKATNHHIRLMLNQLAKECRETDEVIVYFSGHGYRPQIESGMNESYLCTYDFNEQGVALSDGTSYISAALIKTFLSEQVRARRVLFILDCCYSGGFEMSTHQDGMVRERLVEYFENSALHSGSHAGYLCKVASATSREFVSSERREEGIADMLRHALHSRDTVTNLEVPGMSNLQEVYRYLEQHT